MHSYEIIVYLSGDQPMSLCKCVELHSAMAVVERLCAVSHPNYTRIEIRILPKEASPPF